MFIQKYYYVSVFLTKKANPRRKPSGANCFSKFKIHSNSARNLTGAQAACTSVYSLRRAVNDCLNLLYIGFPSSV